MISDLKESLAVPSCVTGLPLPLGGSLRPLMTLIFFSRMAQSCELEALGVTASRDDLMGKERIFCITPGKL